MGGVTPFDPEWVPTIYRGVIPREAVNREILAYDHQAKAPVWFAVNDPSVPVEPALLVWRVDGNGVRLTDRPVMEVLLTHEWREHIAGIPPEDRRPPDFAARPTTVVPAPPITTPVQPAPPVQTQPTLPQKSAPPPPVLVDKSVGISRPPRFSPAQTPPTLPQKPAPRRPVLVDKSVGITRPPQLSPNAVNPARPVLAERGPLPGSRRVGGGQRVNATLNRAGELGIGVATGVRSGAQQLGRVVVRRKQMGNQQNQMGNQQNRKKGGKIF